MEAQVKSQGRQCGICGGQIVTGIGLSLSTSFFSDRSAVLHSFTIIHPSSVLHHLSSIRVFLSRMSVSVTRGSVWDLDVRNLIIFYIIDFHFIINIVNFLHTFF